MVNTIQPINQNPVMPQDAFAGQKLERGQEGQPRLIVDKKENATSAKEEVPREKVEQAAEKLNRLMADRRLQFKVNEKSNRIIVKIIDQESGEVLREIPPEKIVEMQDSIQEYLGLLIDKKV